MAANNRLWGAERIRGELLKLGIRVSKRTIQKYIEPTRKRPRGQNWATFIDNHRAEVWSCDFLQLVDVRFAPIFAFFIMELDRRRMVHVGVTREPSPEWVTQQRRSATSSGASPRFLIRDRDAKFGRDFDRGAELTGIKIVTTAVRAPNMNAECEPFLGSVRRECLDHVLVLGEHQLLRILREYVGYHNDLRPHQGIGQGVPTRAANTGSPCGPVASSPVRGGLHHSYRRAA
ncbi:MAG: integrase core domain-containing protein [Deltaproteobacteria bacterium]|nr:integrase core domain-containing protein [Deltaproteobacteria bacterium]